MLKIFFVFAVAIAGYATCSDITLNCEFINAEYKETDPTYDCFIKSLTYSKDDEIIGVTGKHLDGRSNADVTGFVSGEKSISAVPRGLGKFFPNLESLTLQATSISSIKQDDFKKLPKLKVLEIFNSDIEVIPSDVFKYNPKIEWIDFHLNKLSSIDAEAFEGLENLRSLFLDRNACIDKFAPKNRAAVLELIEDVKKSC